MKQLKPLISISILVSIIILLFILIMNINLDRVNAATKGNRIATFNGQFDKNISAKQVITFTQVYTIYLPLIVSSKPNNFATQVAELTNSYRTQNGCQPLTINQKLVNAAQTHTDDMALNDFFSHTGSDGSDGGQRITAAGYSYSGWGENIAVGYSTADAVMTGWMNSAGHRANILDCSFTEIGVGYYYLANDTGNSNFNHYWTQNFGTPQ